MKVEHNFHGAGKIGVKTPSKTAGFWPKKKAKSLPLFPGPEPAVFLAGAHAWACSPSTPPTFPAVSTMCKRPGIRPMTPGLYRPKIGRDDWLFRAAGHPGRISAGSHARACAPAIPPFSRLENGRRGQEKKGRDPCYEGHSPSVYSH